MTRPDCRKCSTHFVSQELVTHVSDTLPQLPDVTIKELVKVGLTLKDAKTLVSIDDGERLDYFDHVTFIGRAHVLSSVNQRPDLEKVAANW